MTDSLEQFKQDVLDPVSSTFCLAKWHRTTVRVDQGLSYSCHHCVPERVDKMAVVDDAHKLTNTDEVMEQRQLMLDDKRPSECEYCWQAEDNGQISDRVIKSYDLWRRDVANHPNIIKNATASTTSIPKVLEISFDNTCNFKCSYCSAAYSSKWYDEIKEFGQYPTKIKRKSLEDSVGIPHREENPFTNAFWDMWPTLRDELIELRITGGEPLMSKNLYRLLDSILTTEYSPLELSINSNFCPPAGLFDKFVGTCQQLNGRIKKLKVYTSIESTGGRAEYSRFGMDHDLFKTNVERFLDETDHELHIMMANNALSVTDLVDVLQYYVSVKRRYPTRVFLNANLVRYPAYLDIKVLPSDVLVAIHDEFWDFMEHNCHWFEQAAMTQLTRVAEYMIKQCDYTLRDSDNTNTIRALQDDFIIFVDEYDQRRGTNFVDTFPELAAFRDVVKGR